jgi:hypothetical protein
MGFINDKTDLFGEISATKALFENFPELNKSFNTYQSVKSKSGNMIPMLLDLLKELVGSNIENQFGELLKKTDKIENKIKDVIIKEVLKKVKESNFSLSGIQNPIVETNIKNIDIDNTLTIPADTDLGKFYYGKAAPAAPQLPNNPAIQVSTAPGGDFQKFLFDTKQTGSGNWKNIINVEWLDEVLKINIDPQYLLNKSLENLLRDFLDSVKILDLSLLTSTILDSVFGAVSSLTDDGAEFLKDKIKLKKLCDKIIDNESLSTGTTPVIYNNDFFNFSKKEKEDIDFLTNNVVNGGNLADLGCGRGETNVDLDDLNTTYDLLQDTKPSLIKDTLVSSMKNILDKSVAGVSDENKNTVKMNIFGQIFEDLTAIITSQTIKPFNLILQQIGESLMNSAGIDPSLPIGAPGLQINNTSLEKSSLEDYFVKFKSLNTCLVKEIYSTIVEFLFDIVKAEVLKLVKIKIAQILQDQQKNYKEQLDSAREVLQNVSNILSFINNIGG